MSNPFPPKVGMKSASRFILFLFLVWLGQAWLLSPRGWKSTIGNNARYSYSSLLWPTHKEREPNSICPYLRPESKEYNDDNDEVDFDNSFVNRVERKLTERFPTSRKEGDRHKPKTRDVRGLPSLYGLNRWEILNRAVVAGVFVAGIGTGITIDSAINTNPKDLASRDAIDRNAPNPKLCATYGASAMALDQRIFITFNPFNVYVTQADTKPGCVLRPSNVVSLLQKERKLISDEEVQACKNGFNTWAFVGDINDKPQLNCVFQSDDAQNEFLSNPKVGLGEDYMDDDDSIP